MPVCQRKLNRGINSFLLQTELWFLLIVLPIIKVSQNTKLHKAVSSNIGVMSDKSLFENG
jgi:hypothetical protein